MADITITVTEVVDAVSVESTPAVIEVTDGVFVDSGGGGGGAVDSVNGETGVVVLSASDVGAQPVDTDLTAIAALTTTTFGRALLALADAAALRTAGGLGTAATQATSAFDAAGAAAAAQAASQPLDSDLTAIAALTTTSFGRAFLALADAAAARTAIGAGTSSFDGAYASLTGKPTLGTAAAAATGDFDATGAAAAAQAASQPLDSDLTAIAALTTTSFGRSLLALADAAAGRTALSLGTAATSAATDFQPIDSDLTSIAALTTTSFGRSLLTAADAAAARVLTGAGTSNLALGTSSSTAKAGDYQPTAANISDSTTIGRSVLTAADAAAVRTAIGLGTAAVLNTGTSSGDIPLLSTGGRLPIARLASGTPDGTKFVRDDGTLVTPSGGGGGSVATDTIFDAKGDLAVGTGSDTAAKLAVGANGSFLVADSSQTTGLAYAAGVVGLAAGASVPAGTPAGTLVFRKGGWISTLTADSPVALITLDETSGVFADQSGNARDFTAGTGVTRNLTPLLGDLGKAASGDGSHDIASLASNGGITTTGTIEAFIKLPAANVQGTVLHVGTSTTGWGLQVGAAGAPGRTLLGVAAGVNYVSPSIAYTFPVGVGTYHVALTFASNTWTWYVNGVSVGSNTLTPTTAGAGLHIGGIGGGTEFLSSTVIVDHAVFYSTALSAQRIKEHAFLQPYSLLGHWDGTKLQPLGLT